MLDDKPFEVIGVMPKGFEFPYGGGEMWTPFVIEPRMKQDHGNHYLRAIALLKPGVTIAQANDELGGISGRIQQQFPDLETGHIAYVEDLNKYFTRGARSAMPALIGRDLRSAHRLFQRRQPVAGARGHSAKRDGGAIGDGRDAMASDAPIADRKRDAGARRGRARLPDCRLGRRIALQSDSRGYGEIYSRMEPNGSELRRARLYRIGFDPDRRPVRPGARVGRRRPASTKR